MSVETAFVGALGCDTDTRVDAACAQALRNARLDFIIRYLGLGSSSTGDLTKLEVDEILGSGLALMAVQHVRMPGWLPLASLGLQDGSHAASNAIAAGLPAGVTLWLDLEGLAPGATVTETIAYCDAWHTAVRAAGYDDGVYVGSGQPLDSAQLFSLKTSRYWRSQSQVPNVDARGYCMIQLYPTVTVAGIAIDYDVIQSDFRHGMPRWLKANGN
jgi:hypothetical protein